MDRDDVVNGVNNAWEATTTIYSVIFEPIDLLTSAYYCLSGECSTWMLAGFLPFIPSSAGKYIDDIYQGAVKNADAAYAVIGHWEEGARSYNKIASNRGATHLFSDRYGEFISRYGPKAWFERINAPYIQREIIDKGKDVMLSTPLDEIREANRTAALEVDMLIEAGYTFINGWLFAPK